MFFKTLATEWEIREGFFSNTKGDPQLLEIEPWILAVVFAQPL